MYQVNSRFMPLKDLGFNPRMLVHSYGVDPEDHAFLHWDEASNFSHDDFKEVVTLRKMLSRVCKQEPHLIRESGTGVLIIAHDNFMMYREKIEAFARGVNDTYGRSFRNQWVRLEFHQRIDWLRECDLDIGIALQDALTPATCGFLAAHRPHAVA
jgi:hypothetical protein